MTDHNAWNQSDETCPKCQGLLETRVKEVEDDHGELYEIFSAERCTRCRWIVDFETESIEAKRY